MAWEKPNWMSIKDAADYLSVGEPTIYRWMRDGRITFRKVGDSTRFLQQDLDAMVELHPSEKDAQIVRQLCPVCHHDGLAEGRIQSTGLIYFRPDHKKTRFWTYLDANVPLQARMCTQCGAISLFGDTDKLQKLQVDKAAAASEGTSHEPLPEDVTDGKTTA